MKLPDKTVSYSERDVAIYALGVGVCSKDPLDQNELKYVYNVDGQQYIKVLPTFSTLFSTGFMERLPGSVHGEGNVLHGEQYTEIFKPLPSNGFVLSRGSVVGVHDKGKAVVVEIEVLTYEKSSGELLCKNRMIAFIEGASGLSGSSPSSSSRGFSFSGDDSIEIRVSDVEIPSSGGAEPPYAVEEDAISPSQALLYRLSGDYNPLHADVAVARRVGLPRPILHGLCTLGYAVRAVIRRACGGDETLVRTVACRFLKPVFPGETLATQIWLRPSGHRVLFRSTVRERDVDVAVGYVHLPTPTSSL